MRILVCGSRDWTNRALLSTVLDTVKHREIIEVIIEGEATGADTMAREWAEDNGILVKKFPADWDRYGKAAGPIRNKQMLVEGKPDLVLAFTLDLASSRGTKNMVMQALEAKVETIDVVEQSKRARGERTR